MKAVVTGASGFIGKALTRRLLAQGWQVYALVRRPEKLEALACEQFHVVKSELGELKGLETRMDERNFDAFFHLAWDGTFGESFRDYHRQLKNAAFAGDALMAAAALKAETFIFAGTVVELEARHYLQHDGAPRVSCLYGAAKTAAEMICRTLAYQNGVNYRGALLASVYGEGDESHMIQNVLITALLRGERPRLVSGENLYDWIYVEDVVSALIAIAERGQNGKTYYVGHRELQTFRSLVTRTRDVVAPGAELVFGTLQDKTVTDYSLIDRDALYHDTGFECTADFEASIRHTAEWLKETSAKTASTGMESMKPLRNQERERERERECKTPYLHNLSDLLTGSVLVFFKVFRQSIVSTSKDDTEKRISKAFLSSSEVQRCCLISTLADCCEHGVPLRGMEVAA